MPFLWRSVSFTGLTILLCAWPALLAAVEPDVGVFTAVEGKVSVQHAQSPEVLSAKLRDTVLFRDLIETQQESRTKALLHDDSILTIGEHSRVEITEHIYDPKRSLRSVVVNLVQGQVRALVGRVFTGSGSKFEVHTPTAVAAARGTYFVIWHVDGASGIANIGSHGNVDFQSGGRLVSVTPGTYSLTPPGGGPPSPPQPATGDNAPAQVTSAVRGTDMKDDPKEKPSHTAQASGGTAPVSQPAQTPAGSSVPATALGSSPPAPITTPVPNVTVPAVISGAVSPPPPPPDSSSPSSPPASPPPPPTSPPPPPPLPPPPPPPAGGGIGIGPGGLPPGQGGIVPGTGQTNPGQGGSHSNRPR